MRPRGRTWRWGAAAALTALGLAMPAARAATTQVPAQAGAVAAAVAKAAPGDTLVLAAGRHEEQGLVLKKRLILEGSPGAELVGPGSGSVIKVLAPGVTVRGLTIRGSGTRPIDFDSAIYVEKGADGFVGENNRTEGNLFGIVLHGANNCEVRGNEIHNRSDRYETELGDGIYLWNVHDSKLENNRIEGGRDGIFSQASVGNLIAGNRMTGLRFAVHYMYSNKGRIIGNLSTGNKLGFTLMYSRELDIERNVSVGDAQHGLMLHTSYHSLMADNLVKGGGDRCVFVYTSSKNVIRGNRIEDCPLGLHFSGGSEENEVYGNSFVNNRTQVKYTGTIYYEWSKDGRGNYWSDNTAFDLKGDGVAATAYRPNSVMDRLVWRYPLAKMLMSSPVMEALKVAQSQFPALMPGGVIDSHPLMSPPPMPADLPQPAKLSAANEARS